MIKPLLTDTWIKKISCFLCDNSCAIEERTPSLQLKRESDRFLIEAFIQAGHRGEKLASLNQCRTILKVTNLSDIATGDSKLTGQPSLLHWSYQGQVSKKQWDQWEEAVKKVFQVLKSNVSTHTSTIRKMAA
eukprot:9594586-Ditylum_brightwellii.AAC.1